MEIRRVERIGVGTKRASDRSAQLMLVGDMPDGIEVGLRGRKPRPVDRVGVEIGVVIIGNEGVVAARRL